MPETSLLKIQIGPVQDFIAAARSTRDLWSGSYLLSWLMAAGIAECIIKCAQPDEGIMVYPSTKAQPLIAFHKERIQPREISPLEWAKDPSANTSITRLLTPNLPNIFVARIPKDKDKAADIGKAVEEAIRKEWNAIAESVWKNRSSLRIRGAKAEFEGQVSRFLSISWVVTPVTGDCDPKGTEAYAEAYKINSSMLDAVRQTRNFAANDTTHWTAGGERDSLNGKDAAIAGGKSYGEELEKRYKGLFKNDDHLGAITLIKRVWHSTYLGLSSKDFPIRSIPAIAARTNKLDDDETPQGNGFGDAYIAAIAFDGDSIGRWVNGDFLAEGSDLKNHHTEFSKALSRFALDRVRPIVEKSQKEGDSKIRLGELIYAGGDDVVCLLPADAALEMTAKLREAFCEETKGFENTTKQARPDASAGIAIGHIHAPLQDLIREAQKAEKHAKNTIGRPAFSVTLMKRSGEISRWGSQWKSNGLELYQAIDDLLCRQELSSKFPHRVCELLTPYLIQTAGISKKQNPEEKREAAKNQNSKATSDSHASMQDALDLETMTDLITHEFTFAISRQSARTQAQTNKGILEEKLRTYLQKNKERPDPKCTPQELLTSVIGLCTTISFAHRNRKDHTPAQTDDLNGNMPYEPAAAQPN